MDTNYDDREVTFEIIEEIGIISTQETGWTREINLVSWNGGIAKYDIREWDPKHYRMSRGITLKEEEMRRLLELMRKRRSNARNLRRPGNDNTETDAGNETDCGSESETSAEPPEELE